MTTLVKNERGKLRTVIPPQTSYGAPFFVEIDPAMIVPSTSYVPQPRINRHRGLVDSHLGPFITPASVMDYGSSPLPRSPTPPAAPPPALPLVRSPASALPRPPATPGLSRPLTTPSARPPSSALLPRSPLGEVPQLPKDLVPVVKSMDRELLATASKTRPLITNPHQVIVSAVVNQDRLYLLTSLDEALSVGGSFATVGSKIIWEDAAGYLYHCVNGMTELMGGYYSSPDDNGTLIELTDSEKDTLTDNFYRNSDEYSLPLFGTINEWARTIEVPSVMTIEQSIPYSYFLPESLKDHLILMGPAVMEAVIGNNGDDCELQIAVVNGTTAMITQYIEYLTALGSTNEIPFSEVYPMINNHSASVERWFAFGPMVLRIWMTVMTDPQTALSLPSIPAYQVGYYHDKLWITPRGYFSLSYRVNYLNLSDLYYGYSRDLVNCALRHGIRIFAPYPLPSSPPDEGLLEADASLASLDENALLAIGWYDVNGFLLFDHYLRSLPSRDTLLTDYRNFFRADPAPLPPLRSSASASGADSLIPVDHSGLTYSTRPYPYEVPLISWIGWSYLKLAARTSLTSPLLGKSKC